DSWKKIRPVSLDGLECASLACGVMDECRGGCRFRAENAGGEAPPSGLRRRDVYKCFGYGIMEVLKEWHSV
ncbi:MAG TPA: hypothetical protein VF790_07890, partial [Dissulfurispiraceae bacterium]